MNTKFDPRFYVYVAKGLRDFADGFVTIVLSAYLWALGFGAGEIGLIATAALLGSAMITLGVGYFGAHIESRKLLISVCMLMAATGVTHALEVTQLSNFASRHPNELSGGQQQRVAIARCLAARPLLMLFDKPLSNLDAAQRDDLRNEMMQLVRPRRDHRSLRNP